MNAENKRYHHGDLSAKLVATATSIVKDEGLDALSLRKLADRIGVSRTAAYHHFKNKNELVCAIATEGFAKWRDFYIGIVERADLSEPEKCRYLFHGYIEFAVSNTEMYDLMFSIWREGTATSALKDIAYPCFQLQVDLTKRWQDLGLLDTQKDTLRLAQVIWATLHGMARSVIDGIYVDDHQVEDMCDTAISVFFKIPAGADR